MNNYLWKVITGLLYVLLRDWCNSRHVRPTLYHNKQLSAGFQPHFLTRSISVCVCVCVFQCTLEDKYRNTHQLTGDSLYNWGKNWFSQRLCAAAWTAHTHAHKTQTALWLATKEAPESSIRLKIEQFSGAAKRQNVKWIWLSWSWKEHGHCPKGGH